MKNYFAPEVEVLDVMVEQGFAATSLNPDSGIGEMGDEGDL